jgi:hypothetical protein
VLGLGVAGASTAVLVSQLWHVRRQLDHQRRMKALVAEAGLPRSFVPPVRTNNRWAIGSSTGFVVGFFWFVWGLVRLRDERRRGRVPPDDASDAPITADAPQGAVRQARGERTPRRRAGRRSRR